MPAVLKHTPCPSCGHRHHFCLSAGRLADGREYTFYCPETGRPAALRADGAAEEVEHFPQGAVQLAPAGDRTSGG